MSAVFVGALAFLVACGGGRTVPPVSTAPTSPVTPMSSTVVGTSQQNFITASGSVSQPQDLTTTYIAAKVPASGGWTTIEAKTQSDGTFQIPGVPTGKYWLITPGGGYWTSATNIDLGTDLLGRSAISVPNQPTYLDISLDGLRPWSDGDAIEMFIPNLNQDYSYQWPDFSLPDAGETSTETLKLWTGPLSNASQGDAWYASQLVNTTVNGVAFRVLAKATPPLAITQHDGATTPLDGSLAQPPSGTVHLKVLGTQFAAATSAIAPAAQLHSTTLGMYVQPFTSSKGAIGHAPTLLERADQQPIPNDADFGDISYGNPFPSQWTPFMTLKYEFLVAYQAAGASAGVSVPVEIYTSTTQLPTADHPLALSLGPVRNIKLNGTSAVQPQNSTTLSPTVSWDAPATGTPTGYRVSIYQLSRAADSTVYRNVIDLFTNENTLAVPDGILESGQQYFFAVRAFSVPGVDLTKAPNRLAFPWSHADALTQIITTL